MPPLRRCVSILAAAIGVVAGAACAARQPPPHRFAAADRDAVSGVLQRQADAWNRGDLATYMDAYARTDALVFTSGSNIRRGWQAAFDHYQARYGRSPSTMGQLAFTILQIDPVGADGAVVLGQWAVTGTDVAGDGVFSVVLERRPEGWRIIHDHTSSTPSPPH
jgi:ketosteroid isomerase-like protein